MILDWDRNRYTLHYLLGCVPEATVQASVLDALRWRGIPAVAVDVGAKEVRGRAFGALKKAGRDDLLHLVNGKSGAGIAGVVDVIGCLPGSGRALFIEVKAPAWYEPSDRTGRMVVKRTQGMPTADQLAFLRTMGQAGACVGVVWGVGDLEFILPASGAG